jgi:DNA-binding CsgD family transcriptional regulator
MDASTLILVVVIDPRAVESLLPTRTRPMAAAPPRPTTAAPSRPTAAPLPRTATRRPPEHTDPAPLPALTRQEATVAAMAGRALTNQQIAHRMGISPHTVNFHLRRVYRKLGICSRVHLARLVPAAEPGPGAAPGAHCDRGSGDDPRP